MIKAPLTMKKTFTIFLTVLLITPLFAEDPNTDNYMIVGGGHSAWDSAMVENAFRLQNSRWLNGNLANQQPVPVRSVVDNSTAGSRAELGFSWAVASAITRGTVLASYQQGFASPPANDTRSGVPQAGTITTDTFYGQPIKRYQLSYIQEIFPLGGSGSTFTGGIAGRVGILGQGEVVKFIGHGTSASSFTFGPSTTTLNSPRYNLGLDLTSSGGMGVIGIGYRVALLKGLELDASVDYLEGKGSGKNKTTGISLTSIGTFSLPSSLKAEVSYDTKLRGAQTALGGSYALTQLLTLRLSYEIQHVESTVTKAKPKGGGTEAFSALLIPGGGAAASAALLAGSLPNLGPMPSARSVERGWRLSLQLHF